MNNKLKALIKDLGKFEGCDDPGGRIETVKKIKSMLSGVRDGVREKHISGCGGASVSALLTGIMDFLVRELFALYLELNISDLTVDDKALDKSGGNLSIVAIGGYGRNELQPYSDIDIFFLFKGRLDTVESNIVSGIVTALWDFGFEVGHVSRTASECIALIKSDIPSKTALIDSRFLLGNPDNYREFKTRLTAEITKNFAQSVVDAKLGEMEARHKKYGSTVFVAEPQLKEGVGGLRDYHTALWVSASKFNANTISGLRSRGIIDERECESVTDAVDFLLRVRNELHFLTSRREDTLLFEFQKQVAEDLQYGKKKSDVDRFIRDYFKHARTVAVFSKSTLYKCQSYKRFSPFTLQRLKKRSLGSGFESIGNLIFVKGYNPEIFKNDPILLVEVFLLCQKRELVLSEPVKQLITHTQKNIDSSFFSSGNVSEKILQIFSGPFSGKILRAMHETDVLKKILPEIESIVFYSARDHYHFYTVDEHTLRTIEIFDTPSLRKEEPDIYRIYLEIEDKEIILFALLFHDIQKLGTSGHAERGAEIADRVLKRWGVFKGAVIKIVRLVRYHVLMGHIAFRRDLDDTQVIQEFCKTINCVDELKKLYVMTCADIKSVAPSAWTEWKGVMLKELFLRSYTYLENRETFSDSQLVLKKKEEFCEACQGLTEEIETYLSCLPSRFILSMLKEHIPAYVAVMKSLDSSDISIGVFRNPTMRHWELMVCTRSNPGVFAKIAGALSYNNINILGGQIFTRPDGVAIDLFKVSSRVFDEAPVNDDLDLQYKEKMEEEFWERIKRDIRSVLENRVKMSDLLNRRGERKKTDTPFLHGISTRVELFNDISDAYTVIDVVTEDRPALLYHLTDTLYKKGVNIHLAKVGTEGKTAIDVFYVTNFNGKKLENDQRIEEVVSSIMTLLA